MTLALVQLSENSNRVLNIVKAKYNLKDKSQAIEAVIHHYIDCQDEPELRPEFVARISKAESGRFVKVADFRKRYGGD